VRFGREGVEHATALKAAHASGQGWHHIIVGQDVADELAAQYIAACLKTQRAASTASTGQVHAANDDGGEAPAAVPSEEEVKEQRRRAREAEQERRRQATADNLELGAAVLKHMARVKVDERVVKILAAVDFSAQLGQIAARRPLRVPRLAAGDRDQGRQDEDQSRTNCLSKLGWPWPGS
jgi:hypothetical protein